MSAEATGRRRVMTDAELRAALDEGMRAPAIAEQFGIAPQTVYKRIKRLGISTVAAVVAPEESRRYVGGQIDALEELLANLSVAHRLRDACERELSDPSRAGEYYIGPRAEETEVVYTVVDVRDDDGRPILSHNEKRKLSELIPMLEETRAGKAMELRLRTAETKIADPRTLVLSVLQEVRQTVAAAADLARLLADARAMEAFREAVIEAVRGTSPETAEAIAESVRRSILLRNAAGGLGTVPAGAGDRGAG